MAVYDLEEQEQIAALKAWWTKNANLVTTALMILAVAALGWQGWNYHQRQQTGQAAAAFGVLQQAVQVKDISKIKAAGGELLEKYRGTNYAQIGALNSAKALLDAGDRKSAIAQLTWLTEHGDNEFKDLARLRLAALLLDDKAFDEALKQVAQPGPGFAVRFAEMRGDILLAQAKPVDARTAYMDAMKKLEEAIKGDPVKGQTNLLTLEATQGYRDLLQQKIDALGGAA